MGMLPFGTCGLGVTCRAYPVSVADALAWVNPGILTVNWLLDSPADWTTAVAIPLKKVLVGKELSVRIWPAANEFWPKNVTAFEAIDQPVTEAESGITFSLS